MHPVTERCSVLSGQAQAFLKSRRGCLTFCRHPSSKEQVDIQSTPAARRFCLLVLVLASQVAEQSSKTKAQDRSAVLPNFADAILSRRTAARAFPWHHSTGTQQAEHGSSKEHGKEALDHIQSLLVHAKSTSASHHDFFGVAAASSRKKMGSVTFQTGVLRGVSLCTLSS